MSEEEIKQVKNKPGRPSKSDKESNASKFIPPEFWPEDKEFPQPFLSAGEKKIISTILYKYQEITGVREFITTLESYIKDRELKEKKAKLLAELAAIDSELGVEQPKDDKGELGE